MLPSTGPLVNCWGKVRDGFDLGWNSSFIVQARAEIRKDALAGDWLHFSLDNFPVSSLRLFQPSALDVGVSRAIKFGDQGAD